MNPVQPGRALLSLRGLAVHYATPAGPVRAVDGATFDVPPATVVGLVGESGCGKSTLGRAVMGVLPRSARIAGGEAWFEGENLLALSPPNAGTGSGAASPSCRRPR
ncbi:ATP-binding cassette domain-containing protein [Roseomonas sp. CCTCC AB2023176]|uniref:ATP-binding cassette domain-containing protein n=1 Tax=Roseomonas sp. CCTCC AB2023176 TaxID=3342640 RepID=UPI0035DA90EC